jgi:hypothetical protein
MQIQCRLSTGLPAVVDRLHGATIPDMCPFRPVLRAGALVFQRDLDFLRDRCLGNKRRVSVFREILFDTPGPNSFPTDGPRTRVEPFERRLDIGNGSLKFEMP